MTPRAIPLPVTMSWTVPVDAIGDGTLALGALALTVYLWKASWLKPAEYSKTLWTPYPSRLT